MLNLFHAFYPGGILLGAVVGYFMMDRFNISWQIYVATLIIPLLIYGFLFLGQKVPVIERIEMGVTNKQMWKSVISPLFLIMGFLMLFTAATEVSTSQRLESLLKDAGVSGLLVLAFITGIMTVGRIFAGPMVKIFSTRGLLWISAVISFVGLIWLSYSQGAMTFVAAAVFAIGVCYFWPTMIGFVSEYIPESGALGLSLIGGLGQLSAAFGLPILGRILDLSGSGAEALRYMAVLPAFLIIAFGILYFSYKRQRNLNTQENRQ